MTESREQKSSPMAANAAIRPAVHQFMATAWAEARLAAGAATGMARGLRIAALWGVAAIFLGMAIGLSAVILPPTGTFGVVGVAALVLIWVTPELPTISDKVMRRLFFVMLVVDLCVPNYYAIDALGLPWISVRRMATFALIVVFATAIASSASVRGRILANLAGSKSIAVCAFGFLVMCGLSVFTSINPSASVSQITEIILNWYVPFIALLYAIRDEKHLLLLVRVLGVCALYVALAGVAEFFTQHRFFVELIPKPLLNSLMEKNITFANFVNSSPFRNGVWRASSVFASPLSLGEFGGMIAPVGLFFFAHSRRVRSRVFGAAILISCLVAIACSGSRGGYITYIAATVSFTALWLIRTVRWNKGSLAPALVGVSASIGFVILLGLILFWPRLHNVVLGGGQEAYSNQSRIDQMHTAWPKIVSNPITGHGVGNAGDIIGYYTPGSQFPTVDSYVLALAAETGIPSVLFFFGMIVISAWLGGRSYILNPTRLGALAGCLACSMLAFGIYRFFLAERENQTLFFELVACMIVLSRVTALSYSTNTSRDAARAANARRHGSSRHRRSEPFAASVSVNPRALENGRIDRV